MRRMLHGSVYLSIFPAPWEGAQALASNGVSASRSSAQRKGSGIALVQICASKTSLSRSSFAWAFGRQNSYAWRLCTLPRRPPTWASTRRPVLSGVMVPKSGRNVFHGSRDLWDSLPHHSGRADASSHEWPRPNLGISGIASWFGANPFSRMNLCTQEPVGHSFVVVQEPLPPPRPAAIADVVLPRSLGPTTSWNVHDNCGAFAIVKKAGEITGTSPTSRSSFRPRLSACGLRRPKLVSIRTGKRAPTWAITGAQSARRPQLGWLEGKIWSETQHVLIPTAAPR